MLLRECLLSVLIGDWTVCEHGSIQLNIQGSANTSMCLQDMQAQSQITIHDRSVHPLCAACHVSKTGISRIEFKLVWQKWGRCNHGLPCNCLGAPMFTVRAGLSTMISDRSDYVETCTGCIPHVLGTSFMSWVHHVPKRAGCTICLASESCHVIGATQPCYRGDPAML